MKKVNISKGIMISGIIYALTLLLEVLITGDHFKFSEWWFCCYEYLSYIISNKTYFAYSIYYICL